MTPALPQWDPDIILEALSKPPYVPLREASLKHLTLKTVFFGASNCPVRALRYYHRCMTECPELRKGRRCLFSQDTTRRGRSSVQPLFLVGSAPLLVILMPLFRTARVSQERSKLMKSVLWLIHYNFFQQVDLQAVMKARRWSSGGTFTSFYLRDLCRQANSIRKTGMVIAVGEILEISSCVSVF